MSVVLSGQALGQVFRPGKAYQLVFAAASRRFAVDFVHRNNGEDMLVGYDLDRHERCYVTGDTIEDSQVLDVALWQLALYDPLRESLCIPIGPLFTDDPRDKLAIRNIIRIYNTAIVDTDCTLILSPTPWENVRCQSAF